MSIVIETLEGLKRRFVVEVSPEAFKSNVEKEFNRIAGQVRLDGFRRGKVPLNEVKRRFGKAVLDQVAYDMMEDYVKPVLEEESFDLVSRPVVTHEASDLKTPIKYCVEFEVRPEIDLSILKTIKVEKLDAKITPKAINDNIENLRRQRATWEKVDRPSQKSDRLKLDFKGTINDEPFPGSEAKDTYVELGQDRWIPDFEAGLMGVEANQSLDITATFPDNYAPDLAGKQAVFAVTVHAVESPKLPEMDSEFIKSLGVEGEGTLGMLREEIKKSLTKEIERISGEKVKKTVLKAVMEKCQFELPVSAVEAEIKALKEHSSQMGGGQAVPPAYDDEKLRSIAENKVAQSLLLHAVMKKYDIEPDSERVKAYISNLSLPGKNDQQISNWLENNRQGKQQIEAIVLEEQIMEQLLSEVNVKIKEVDFDTAMKPLDVEDD